VLCGDARVDADYQRLLGPRQAGIVFTDPPYNLPIDGHVGGKGAIKHREFMMGAGEMTDSAFIVFLRDVCLNLCSFSVDGSIHYVCMDWRHLPQLREATKRVYSDLKNVCVWCKDNAGMGSLYRSQHELIFVFKNGTSPHVNNVQLGAFGRYRSNVWRYPGANSFSRSTDEGNVLALHPTVKPVALIADALYDCSQRGAIVLDPFLGSGSTLIAAERTGRHCFGIELDPLYVDTAVRRWEKLTGQPATHAESGETFLQVEKARTRGTSAKRATRRARKGDSHAQAR
jgi:DNA modification methylase